MLASSALDLSTLLIRQRQFSTDCSRLDYGRGRHESLKDTPSAFEATLCSLGKTNFLYSAQKETIITLMSPRIKFAQKTSNARREAVRKANRSSFKQIHDPQEPVRQQGTGICAWVRSFSLVSLELVSAIAANGAAYSFTLKTKPTYPFDPRLTTPAYEKPQFSPLSQENLCGTGVSFCLVCLPRC